MTNQELNGTVDMSCWVRGEAVLDIDALWRVPPLGAWTPEPCSAEQSSDGSRRNHHALQAMAVSHGGAVEVAAVQMSFHPQVENLHVPVPTSAEQMMVLAARTTGGSPARSESLRHQALGSPLADCNDWLPEFAVPGKPEAIAVRKRNNGCWNPGE